MNVYCIFSDIHFLKLYTELVNLMPENSKIRTPEQRSRKMLKEENTILNLEMAIKKEQFRKTQKPKPVFYEESMEDKSLQMVSVSVNETDVKSSNILNSILKKIRF